MSPADKSTAHASLVDSTEYHLRYTVAKPREAATRQDILHALAHAVRGRLIDGLFQTEKRVHESGAKRLVYLSAEFLIGQSLRNNLFNLGLLQEAEHATLAMGFDLSEIVDAETEHHLGMADSGAWPRASWNRSRPWACRPMDLESIINSASLNRKPRTLTKRKDLINGSAITHPGLSNVLGRPAPSHCTAVLKVARTKAVITTQCGWIGR